MLQKIRNSVLSRFVALGIIPSFLFPISSYSAVHIQDAFRSNAKSKKHVSAGILKEANKFIGTKINASRNSALTSLRTQMSAGGPSDVNFSGAAAGDELVDLSTGSFQYAIPLMDVGGYPITISYDAGVTMDQQASMVGLGWSLNMGSINRIVRGVPDDFDGDQITTTMNLRPQLTVVNEFGLNAEIAGFDTDIELGGSEMEGAASLGLSVGFIFNNYTGNENAIGATGSFGVSENFDKAGPASFLSGGVSSSSRSGLSTNLGVSLARGDQGQFSLGLGLNNNSLYGSSLSTSFGYAALTEHLTMGASINGNFSLGMQSYTPTASFEFTNKSWTIDVAAGAEVGPAAFHGSYSRTKSTVCLKENVKSQPAYGYMNQEKGYASNALQDFNLNLPRIHENVRAVNTPMPTNDYFIVAGQGMFRPVRNDAGYVKNPTTKSDGDAAAFSGDVAFGALFEAGVNVNYNYNNTISGNWQENNPLSGGSGPDFAFENSLPIGTDFEKAKYTNFSMVKVNNRGSSSLDRYVGMREETALRQEIYNESGEIKGHNYMAPDDGGSDYYPNANTYFQKERRNQNEVLVNRTNKELRISGETQFTNYTLNNFSFEEGDFTSTSALSRTVAKYPDHHLGELTLVSAGGNKDVYGIPVMNETDQVSFNVSAINKDEGATDPIIGADGLVSYATGVDNSLNNDRGDNNLYLKNHVPSHATGYLLTEQQSADYVDLTDNGPTPDDYGSYVKFNYSFLGQGQWRFPFESGKATYNEGFKSNLLDDVASYAYGKRDDWLVHSIETKNYIAEFVYSTRNDAHGVIGEDGGIDLGNPSYKLDEIRLYTRKGKEHGELPVKTVYFTYSYELCLGTPDNSSSGGGKLTLKEVYFTGQDSPEGKLHKYKFNYANNAPYNPSQVDRWGNYQTGAPVSFNALSVLDNSEYPYTKQEKTTADLNAKKWKLSSINLPTGGRLEVDYEAGDYEYVQDVEATRMFKVSGFYSSDEGPGEYTPVEVDFNEVVYDPDNKDQKYFYMLVDLDGAILGSESEALAKFEKDYLPVKNVGEDRYLYFNTLLNLAPHNDGIIDPDVYEYIQGYAALVNNGWYLLETSPGSGIWDKIVYQVRPEKIDEKNLSEGVAHPVSLKACKVIKEALTLVLYPEDDLQAIYAHDGLINCDGVELDDGETDPDLSDDSKNHKKNIKSVRSVYHMMKNTGYASRAVVDSPESKCWVRMRPGNAPKIGGGYRVKEIRMYDNWSDVVPSENSAVYGTTYDYTTYVKGIGTISSGVASYEPLNGGDEIALRTPHFYIHEQKGVPSEKFYSEFPINEEVYATTQVCYSRVTVKSISYDGISLLAPGSTQYEHFTAKDYPVRFDETNIDEGTVLRKPGIVGVLGISKRRFGVSYGTSIVTNDMHRKFKSKKVFDQNGNTIYSMEHRYHEVDGKLDNVVSTIMPNGSKEERMIGQHEDFLTFLNKSESNHTAFSLKVGFSFPPPLPSLWPGANTSENTIYTSLTSKIIYQTGLLEEVMVQDNGRNKFTTNLFYDAKSGAPIVTEITPEKGDGIRKMYDYSYPAYWAYDQLGLSSENAGIKRINITGTDAIIDGTEKIYFNLQDELLVYEYELTPFPQIVDFVGRYWVIENESTGDYFLADKDGVLFAPDPGSIYQFKVHSPGNRNLTGMAMASVSSLNAPVGSSPYISGYSHGKILNISGVELFEDAKLFSSCLTTGNTLNPYTHNLKGQWKLKHSYSFDGERDYSTSNSRLDGCLTEYQPFWQNVGGTWMAINNPSRPDYVGADPYQNWIQNGAATQFDAHGFGLESKNPLNVYSSAGIGYNHQYTINNAVNARYEEVAFDGFEDYQSAGVFDEIFTPYACQKRHLSGGTVTVSEEEAHTGRSSYFVDGPNNGLFETTVWNGVPAPGATHTAPFMLQPSDQLSGFRLINDEADNRYVLSVWAKEKDGTNPINYDAAGVAITINGSGVTPESIERSNIIDGWQRIEIIFEVSPTAPNGSSVYIQLLSTNVNGVYYDDLRIHPFDSEMQAQVIDPIKQRVVATLDSRNFAKIYQYDENGSMIRMIQETERGRQTVKENRSSIVSND